MSERIRVEIEEDMNGMTVTFVGEALSRKDAVNAAIAALEEYDEVAADE